MRKGLRTFAAPVTVAVVLGLAVYAVPAMGGSSSLVSRVARLEATSKKLAAANAKLAATNVKLTKRIASLESFAACNEEAAGVKVAGDPATGSGFEYTPDNKVTVTLTRGIRPVESGETTDVYLQLVDADCLKAPAAKSLRLRRSG